MMARLTVTDIRITDLVKPQGSDKLMCHITAHFAETHWLINVAYSIEPNAPVKLAIDKFNICFAQLMNYINYPYNAPCENPFTGTNEVKEWYDELKRIGIEPISKINKKAIGGN